MSAAPQIDYDKLAAEHGGKPAEQIDYDALAAQHGGKAEDAPAPAKDPGFFEKHNLLRETLLGGMGTYVPESAHPGSDLVKGALTMADPRPHNDTERKMMVVSGPMLPVTLPAMRVGRGLYEQAKQGATEMYEGMGSPKADLHSASLQPFDTEKIAHGAGTMLGLTSQAALPLAEEGIGKVTGPIKGSIPSTQRAGSALGEVKAKAGAEIVDPAGYSDSILRVKDLADRGGTMPTAVNKLLQRITNPKLGPLTFEEGRDFYSNVSRLSVDEMNKLSPVMKRAVGDLRVKFGESLAQTADRVGLGDKYRGAMKEFAQAADVREKLADVKAHLVKYGTMTAAGWAGLKAAEYAVAKALVGLGD